MNKLIITSVLAVFFLPIPTYAGTPVKGEALKKLYAGNTVHGHHINKGFDFLNYFSEDGKAIRKRDDGKMHEGKWFINDDGDMCVNFGRFGGCGELEDNGDGTYTRTRDGKPIIKINKFTSGKGF